MVTGEQVVEAESELLRVMSDLAEAMDTLAKATRAHAEAERLRFSERRETGAVRARTDRRVAAALSERRAGSCRLDELLHVEEKLRYAHAWVFGMFDPGDEEPAFSPSPSSPSPGSHLWFLGHGPDKIGAIKALRSLKAPMGLAEAKAIVESAFPTDLGPVQPDHDDVRVLLRNHRVEWRSAEPHLWFLGPGPDKNEAIKAVRILKPGMGLVEAQAIVESGSPTDLGPVLAGHQEVRALREAVQTLLKDHRTEWR